ncbi:MAG: hypothetical protein PHN49_08325 [Candidatus Omnitrophica bacterium]|nr:hypothetical protein [Candidatus Omnitrophota bacterium]MDD5671630.1 hypothetical protein [Candidatus Omnitrophota bacterium]
MKKALLIILSMIVFAVLLVFGITNISLKSSFEGRNRMRQIVAQEQVLKDGDRLVDQGRYLQALKKYEESLNSKFILKDEDKRGPIVRKIRLYRVTSNFKDGLNEMRYAPRTLSLDSELSVELEALQEWNVTNAKQPVLEYIDHLKHKYQESLPPKDYDTFSSIAIGQILRLYDTIGDYDAGIAFIDEILAYFRTGKAGDPKPGRVDAEYMKVREAFEAEKRNGGPACGKWGPKVPGLPRRQAGTEKGDRQDQTRQTEGGQAEYCIGDATKALIQSDYFPW